MAFTPRLKLKKKNFKRRPSPQSTDPESILDRDPDALITSDVGETVSYLNDMLGENADFVIREFHVMGCVPAMVAFFCHMNEAAQQKILKPIMAVGSRRESTDLEGDALREMLMNDLLYPSEGFTEQKWSTIIEGIMSGLTVVHVQGIDEAFIFETREIAKRSITQPETEQVIRGPREGFIEMLSTNLSLIRYRLQSPNLRVKLVTIGSLTRTKVAVCYLEGVVNPALVEEVNHRLSMIEMDGIVDSGYLEQLIEDNHLSPFPQIQNTERPDKAVANMLEGRVILIVDGSPIALILPTVFGQFYQTSEDYAERFLLVSFIRLARLLAIVFSLIFPSLYVAVISFNPELIPTEFAVAVAGGRSGVPFPSVVEVLVMEMSMEVLREATIRLPQQVGGALSIVGVLVVGQAAVSAGFVSPITVVVIALTTIGSFATPAYNAALALRLLRFPLIIFAGTFGLYGVMVGLILIVNHMLSLKSFGVPYLSPIVPGNFQGMKDTLMRAPLWWLKRRPVMLHTPRDKTLNTMKYQKLAQSRSNVLDPISPGIRKKGDSNGQSASSNGDSGIDNND